MHQSCSVEGNDLNHLVEGNQAGLFECIKRPSPLPSSHTKIFYIPNIKGLALVVSDNKVFFHAFPRWASAKHVTPEQADFVLQGLNFIILGRGQLGDVLSSLHNPIYKTCDPGGGEGGGGTIFDPRAII